MDEPINLDGFADEFDLRKAISHLKGRGSSLYRTYAKHKTWAMRARLRGDINIAQMHENTLDNIYERLPKYLQW